MKLYLLFIAFFAGSLAISAQDFDYEKIEKQFTADTARVEKQVRDMIDSDFSTMGMIDATIQLEKGYDELLNKYYRILYDRLDTEGKNALKASQRNWIKLRDSDKLFIGELHRIIYNEMGGGTMWSVLSASQSAELTRQRVITLYEYLMFGK